MPKDMANAYGIEDVNNNNNNNNNNDNNNKELRPVVTYVFLLNPLFILS